MARRYVIIEDDRYDEALRLALEELSATAEEVEVKVLQEGSSGFLGFLSKPFKIKVTLKDKPEDPAADAPPEAPAVAKRANWTLLPNPEGIFLVVEKCGPGERPPEMAEVLKDLRTLGLSRADLDAVRNAFLPQNTDMPIRIAAADPAFSFDRDAKIEVAIDRDGMSAAFQVTKPFGSGKIPTRDEIVDRLRQYEVRVPLDEATIERALAERRFDEQIVVARGIAPVHGTPASIRWKLDFDTEQVKISIRDDGTVDFHKALKINNVRAGDIIGEKRDPVPGRDGNDVRMKPLPAKEGRDLPLQPGRNVELTEDGRRLVSAIDGQVVLRGNVPTVLPVFEVRGNVDIATGDVDFVGNVIVHGDVTDGFEVKADGNVEVRGMVNCSRVQASGNVLILGGFLGKEKGEIVASGSIGVKFVENGILRAGENILVEKAVMHSTMMAGRRIQVKGTKGLIVGGQTTAGDEVEAVTLGSALGTKTVVSVGVDFASREKIVRLDKELEEININLEKIQKTLGFFEKIAKASGALAPEQELLRTKSLSIMSQLLTRKRELETEKIAIDAGIEASSQGRVVCNNIIYPGVSIAIRKAVLLVRDPIKCSALTLRDGEVRIGPI